MHKTRAAASRRKSRGSYGANNMSYSGVPTFNAMMTFWVIVGFILLLIIVWDIVEFSKKHREEWHKRATSESEDSD